MNLTIPAVAVMVMIFAPEAPAQWAKYPDKSIPRSRDGAANLSGRAPQTTDGKPDLSGVWLADPDPKGIPLGVEQMVFPRYFVNIVADMKPEEVPLQPKAADLLKQRLQNQGKDAPTAHCQPTGIPALDTVPLPFKIIQTPGLVVTLYEENSISRQIFLDGRQPVQDPEPRWMGYSSGKWVGDTLVVDTVGFNDRSWLDAMGHPHSDALHLIERFRRRDAGHLDIEVTIDDSQTYTKPITYTVTTTLVPDEDLLEYFCTENEKDVQRYE